MNLLTIEDMEKELIHYEIGVKMKVCGELSDQNRQTEVILYPRFYPLRHAKRLQSDTRLPDGSVALLLLKISHVGGLARD